MGSIYDHLLGEEATQNAIDLANGKNINTSVNLQESMLNLCINISSICKSMIIWMLPLSIIIGIVMLMSFKNTAWIKKTAIFVFILGIPLCL